MRNMKKKVIAAMITASMVMSGMTAVSAAEFTAPEDVVIDAGDVFSASESEGNTESVGADNVELFSAAPGAPVMYAAEKVNDEIKLPINAYELSGESTNSHTFARYAWINKDTNELNIVIDLALASGGKKIIEAEVVLEKNQELGWM